jgi:hypothetical protein
MKGKIEKIPFDKTLREFSKRELLNSVHANENLTAIELSSLACEILRRLLNSPLISDQLIDYEKDLEALQNE